MVQSLDTPRHSLTATASQSPPVWSADGTRIYFLGAGGVFAVVAPADSQTRGGQCRRISYLARRPGSGAMERQPVRRRRRTTLLRMDLLAARAPPVGMRKVLPSRLRLLPCSCDFRPTASNSACRCIPTRAPNCGCCPSRLEVAGLVGSSRKPPGTGPRCILDAR
jgi:hypothetical protein